MPTLLYICVVGMLCMIQENMEANMEQKKIIMITLRLKKEVAIAYKQYLIEKHKSVTEDLTAHIERQSQHYHIIDDYEPMKTTSKEYTK